MTSGKPSHEDLERRIRYLEEECSKGKRAESELQFQSLILQNMAEGVLLVRTGNGIIVYTNLVFERMFGYEPGELLGRHVSAVNAPSDKSPKEAAEEIISSLQQPLPSNSLSSEPHCG
jgi:PAS domain-containing protein